MSPRLSPWAAVAAAALLVVFGPHANAQTYTWNLDTPGGTQTTPHVYSDNTNTYTITAYGYTTDNGPTGVTLGETWGPGGSFDHDTGTVTPHNLYGKNEGFGEIGLGLDGLSSNEIQFQSFVQLDVSNLYANGFISMTMAISSMQDGEGYYLWGSNVLGTPGTMLRTQLGEPVEDEFTVPDFGTYTYFGISATPITGSSSDILIRNATATVPEPSTLMLLGIGLVAFVGYRRRRRCA